MTMARNSSPAWLEERRREATEIFTRLPVPDRKSELFKFTALSAVDWTREASVAEKATRISGAVADAEELGHGRWLDGELEISGNLGAAIRVESLSAFLGREAKEKLPPLGKLAEDKFAALSEAKWNQGTYLDVAPRTQVEKSLRIAQEQSPTQGSFHFRSLIRVGAGAELVLVDELGDGKFRSLSGELVTGLSDVEVGEGARLRLIQLQGLSEGTDYFLRQRIQLARGARCEYFSLFTGGRKGQVRLEVDLADQGAEFKAVGVSLGDGEQHCDWVANFHHRGSNTSSGLDQWSVLSGKARAVFNGLVHVEKDALNTDAFQKSRALLLSKAAVMHSMPKLIIATDEVACQHGASISSVDPEQKFYLESRGLSPEQALRFIVDGFTDPVMQALPTEALRARLGEAIAAKRLQ